MVRALILGFVAWCVEAVLLVVLIAAAFAAAGPRTIDAGPPCPSGADWRQLGGDGSLLPKFFASHPLDSTARVEACLALASTDLAAAKVGIGRLGSAAAPPLFARLRAASGDDRTSLDVLLQAALPKAFPSNVDDGSEEEHPVERWLQIATIEGPDLTPHEAELAVDRLVIHPSKGRDESVRRLGTVAVPSLVRAMGLTRSREELHLLTRLAHEATTRGPELRLTATSAEVNAAVDNWTAWLDDHRWDYEPHPADRRIPWALRETRLARMLERAWSSWTTSETTPIAQSQSTLATVVTAERALAALALARGLLALFAQAALTLRLPRTVALAGSWLPGLGAAVLLPRAASTAGLGDEVLLLLATSAVSAACLLLSVAHEERLRLDPLARLVERTKPFLSRAALAATAPCTLLAVLALEARGHLGGLGSTLAHGDWMSPASLPGLTRAALVLPALRLALRVLRHGAGDELFSANGESHIGARAMVSDADLE